MYKKFGKRILDVILAVFGLIILGVPMLIVAALIKLTSPGPALFKQERIGLHGKVFVIYKFRSMRTDSEHTGSGVYSSRGDPRVTRLGRILRATSIDELPQFINILRGDMSFVGPRPPLTYHPWPLEQYTQEQRRMFDVRPGITGWAQIHGRKCLEWHERIRLNVWYVDYVSFMLDIQILLKTFAKVLTSADNENNGATIINEDAQKEENPVK